MTGATAFGETKNFNPLAADLADDAYPHPVKVRAFEDQALELSMAYMDVAPRSHNGRTVILFHGKNFSGACWSETITALNQQEYRVVVPDQIGFGKSSNPRNSTIVSRRWRFDRYIKPLSEFLEEGE